MQLTMSSYHHAEYFPKSYPSLQSYLSLTSQITRGKFPNTPDRPQVTGYQNPHYSDEKYNTSLCIMSYEKPESEKPEHKSTIDDLVRSDDLFLDQLETMHYLSFSDW